MKRMNHKGLTNILRLATAMSLNTEAGSKLTGLINPAPSTAPGRNYLPNLTQHLKFIHGPLGVEHIKDKNSQKVCIICIISSVLRNLPITSDILHGPDTVIIRRTLLPTNLLVIERINNPLGFSFRLKFNPSFSVLDLAFNEPAFGTLAPLYEVAGSATCHATSIWTVNNMSAHIIKKVKNDNCIFIN